MTAASLFDYCMEQEAIWRKAEYSATDHAEKARCHRWRWFWMDSAVNAIRDGKRDE